MRMEAAKRNGSGIQCVLDTVFDLKFGWGKRMKSNRIEIEDAVLQDGKLWFCMTEYRYLISMDVETGDTKTYEIPIESTNIGKKSFISMALMRHKIYLIPLGEKVIMQFDVITEEFEKIDIDDKIVPYKKGMFFGVGKSGKYLFIMGAFAPAILRMDTFNNHIDYIMDWYQEAEKLIFDFKDIYFRRQCVVKDNKLYVPFCNANAVLELDCISMKTRVHKLGEKKQGYSGVCVEGNTLWFSPRKSGDIVTWDIVTKQINTISVPGLQKLSGECTYAGILANNNKKMLFPMKERKKVDIEEKNIEELKGKFFFVQDDGTYSVFFEKNSGIITIMEHDTDGRLDIRFPKINVGVARILKENNNYIVENEMVGIRDFIEYVNTDL